MVTSVCQGAGRQAISGQCDGWGDTVSCCRPTNAACLVAAWSAWSACPKLCNGGTQTRTRAVIAQASGSGFPCPPANDPQRLESQRCDVCSACVLSAYSNWSSCSKSCGTGQRTRTRTVQQQAECDCAPCSSTLKETQDCNTQPCPVDCAVTPWSPFSNCNAPCGGGQQLRQRNVVTPAANGGKACGALTETQDCNPQACQCTLSEWSPYSACSKTCGGGGTQRRQRTITANAANCGAALTEDRECGIEPCPTVALTPQPPMLAGVLRSDGSITVDFCDPKTLPITLVKEATAELVTGVNLDIAPQDASDALERSQCSLATRNGAGGALTLTFSRPMVFVSLKLSGFDGNDVGEFVFDDGLKKRTQQVIALTGRDTLLETATFRGHQSYAIIMQGTSQFGIEAIQVRPPDGRTFVAATTKPANNGGLEESVAGRTGGMIVTDPNETGVAAPEPATDLLPLWIVLAVLACLIATLLTIYCIISNREKKSEISVGNNMASQSYGVGVGYGSPVANSGSAAGYPTQMPDAVAPGYPTQMMYGSTMNAGANGDSVNTFQDAPTIDFSNQNRQYGSLDKMPTAARDY